jgi:hypothetical protein
MGLVKRLAARIFNETLADGSHDPAWYRWLIWIVVGAMIAGALWLRLTLDPMAPEPGRDPNAPTLLFREILPEHDD